MKFEQLKLLPELLQSASAAGYKTATPIQEKCIPAILKGRDVLASAQTGTGKTAAFIFPLLQIIATKKYSAVKNYHADILILAPTRELAAQVHERLLVYGKNIKVRSAVAFGGVNINPQIKLLRRGVNILVATPGRLLDLEQQGAVKLNMLRTLVIDEADRMLDMGFIPDINKVLTLVPQKRKTLFFSATFPDSVRRLAKKMLHNPLEIDVSPRNSTVDKIKQRLYSVDKKNKSHLLVALIDSERWTQVLVFTRTKHGANKLARTLDKQGIKSDAIHGNKSQAARTRALSNFKSNKIIVLVATDIAARGIDISSLPQVVNFDLPNVPEDYVHRIGRTARAGKNGCATSLVSHDEIKQLRDIESLIKRHIARKSYDGFEPENILPESKPFRKKTEARAKKRPIEKRKNRQKKFVDR